MAPIRIAEQYSKEVDGIGLAIAGTVASGVLTWSANIGLHDIPFADELASFSRQPPVVVNDARAAGFAESQVGAAIGLGPVALAVTVGTGIGGALIVGDQLIAGTGQAGEIGHMVVDIDGPPCPCGRRGCWERLVGGRAIAEIAASMYPGSVSALDHFVRDAERGERRASGQVARLASLFAEGIDNLAAVLAPNVIVLGGGILARNGPIAEAYRGALSKLRWTNTTRIVDSALGDTAGQVGAALLASRSR